MWHGLGARRGAVRFKCRLPVSSSQQDDQLPNEQGTWLKDMIKVFDAYPQLGILGMNTYRLCKHTEMTNRYGWTFWDPDPKTGVKWSFAQVRQLNLPSAPCERNFTTHAGYAYGSCVIVLHPALLPYRITPPQHVDFAPMAIRASIYHELGGLDEGISRPGDCGIWGDWELTNRAWMDGWQVRTGGRGRRRRVQGLRN